MAGPSVNPTPKLMPMIAMPLLRPAPSVLSAIMALAVATLPAQSPTRNRAAYSSPSDPIKAVANSRMAAARKVAKRMGFRPIRSDIFPHSGAIKNWPSDCTAYSRPTSIAEPPTA